MKKAVLIPVLVLTACLFTVSLASADFANYAGPQLEWISNAIPKMWEKSREDVLWIMSIFPDFECTDYEFQISCSSRFNTDMNNNIYITFFTDDYETNHNNLWKVAVTADLQKPEQAQDLLRALWLDGLKPSEWVDSPYEYPNVQLLFFKNETTELVIYDQKYKDGNNPFFLAEYYSLAR